MATENPSINSVKTKKQKTPVKKKFGKDCGRCGYQHDKGSGKEVLKMSQV